jgi:hypothetical protein
MATQLVHLVAVKLNDADLARLHHLARHNERSISQTMRLLLRRTTADEILMPSTVREEDARAGSESE